MESTRRRAKDKLSRIARSRMQKRARPMITSHHIQNPIVAEQKPIHTGGASGGARARMQKRARAILTMLIN